MASEPALRAAATQTGVLLAGAAAAWAGTEGLYASALTAALAGAALAFARVDEVSLRSPRRPRSEPSVRGLDAPLLRALLNEAPLPLLLVDERRHVRALNRAARGLFDVEDRIASPPTALRRALREEPAGGRLRLSFAAGGGAPRLYALGMADLGAPGARRLAALVDVQAEVHAAEAETLRRTLQVLGHELMNSLTPVVSLAGTAADLLAGAPDAEAVADAREALDVIGRRADGLARFVDGYRAVARLPEPRPRAVDVAQLAEDVLRLVQAAPGARGVAVRLRRPPEPVVRITDPDLVGQALTNLLVNAVEAVTAAGVHPREVELVVEPLPGRMRLEVRDSGPGVSAVEAQSVFLPFTTHKPNGTGVGLHLARSAARSLGGDVEVLPRGDDRWTRFVLTF